MVTNLETDWSQDKHMNRKNYISTLRVIAMFAVIAIHVCTTAWTDFSGFSKSGGHSIGQ